MECQGSVWLISKGEGFFCQVIRNIGQSPHTSNGIASDTAFQVAG
jgi:hypothetical protein